MPSGSNDNRRSPIAATDATGDHHGSVMGLTDAESAAAPAVGSYDAIIIGAGFAGVTAARELRVKGLRPLVLEAMDRIGGRVWSSTYQGELIERGGAWLHPNYELAYREVNRYGLKTVEDVPPEQIMYHTGEGFTVVDPVETTKRVGGLLAQVFDGSQEYFARPRDPLFRKDLLSSVDPLSLRDRMDRLNLSEDDRRYISGELAIYSGGDSRDGGLTALAQWWALCDWNHEGWAKMSAARVETGISTLAQSILDSAQAEVRLSSPVTEIDDDGKRVTVTVRGGQTFRAPVVVLAVPVNVWKNIKITPGLPAVHTEATREGVGVRPNAAKMWLRVAGDIGRVSAIGREGDPLAAIVPHGRLSNGDQLIIALNGPGLDVNDRAAVDAALKKILPKAEVVDHKVSDWTRAPYIQGGWGMRRPGQMLRQLPEIQQPHGRIAFATADICSGWIGSFEGAIESGFRAAEQAAGLVSGKRALADL
jgi:monoamine oxidase